MRYPVIIIFLVNQRVCHCKVCQQVQHGRCTGWLYCKNIRLTFISCGQYLIHVYIILIIIIPVLISTCWVYDLLKPFNNFLYQFFTSFFSYLYLIANTTLSYAMSCTIIIYYSTSIYMPLYTVKLCSPDLCTPDLCTHNCV